MQVDDNITRGSRRVETKNKLTQGSRRSVTDVTRGSRRGSPELNLSEQGEGGDYLVHTKEGSDSMHDDAKMDAVITPSRDTNDIGLNDFNISKTPNG